MQFVVKPIYHHGMNNMEKIHGQMNREWNGTKLSNSRREKADYETAYQYRRWGIIMRIDHVALYGYHEWKLCPNRE